MLNVFSDLPHSGMFELTVKHLDRTRIDFHALLLNPPAPEMPPLARAFRARRAQRAGIEPVQVHA